MTVLRAARVLDVRTGREIAPGLVVVRGERIVAVGANVRVPAGAVTVKLRGLTLLPGLIDAHVHLFLHPGRAEDMQTVRESAPQRTVQATLAAKADLWAGFTTERDMGTEGVGSASTAIRDAINAGEIPGPRLWVCANAISILGGHEDALGFNPALLIPANADLVNDSHELIRTIREQIKEGADFIKIYQTGKDQFIGGRFFTPYQFTEAQLAAAVQEAARVRKRVAVHVMGEPGALYAAQAGVMSLDHAVQLSSETMAIMRAKSIPAVPTFTIFQYFAEHGSASERVFMQKFLDYKIQQFRKQIAAGIEFAAGSDVGPFPHGTQAEEYVLLVRYGLTPLRAIQAGTLAGAQLLGASDYLGQLTPGYSADVIGVPGDPLRDISVLRRVQFVMKAGKIYRMPSQPDWLKTYWKMWFNH
ncbi:MAG TPA: amidohydrolase family protein [Terriglobia bacterium]|nr:amidohydrolase family protein [Terriglobia bacterium]